MSGTERAGHAHAGGFGRARPPPGPRGRGRARTDRNISACLALAEADDHRGDARLLTPEVPDSGPLHAAASPSGELELRLAWARPQGLQEVISLAKVDEPIGVVVQLSEVVDRVPPLGAPRHAGLLEDRMHLLPC